MSREGVGRHDELHPVGKHHYQKRKPNNQGQNHLSNHCPPLPSTSAALDVPNDVKYKGRQHTPTSSKRASSMGLVTAGAASAAVLAAATGASTPQPNYRSRLSIWEEKIDDSESVARYNSDEKGRRQTGNCTAPLSDRSPKSTWANIPTDARATKSLLEVPSPSYPFSSLPNSLSPHSSPDSRRHIPAGGGGSSWPTSQGPSPIPPTSTPSPTSRLAGRGRSSRFSLSRELKELRRKSLSEISLVLDIIRGSIPINVPSHGGRRVHTESPPRGDEIEEGVKRLHQSATLPALGGRMEDDEGVGEHRRGFSSYLGHRRRHAISSSRTRRGLWERLTPHYIQRQMQMGKEANA